MANKNNYPEVRLAGYSEEWLEESFYKLFSGISNNSLSRDKLNYNYGKAKNIHYGDILIKYNEILDVANNIIPYITDDDIVEKLKGSKLIDGDILLADAAEDKTVGKCIEMVNVNEEIILSGLHTIAVRPQKNFASKYLGYYLNSDAFHDQLLGLMQGTKVLSISKTSIKNTTVRYPKNKTEQAQIGNFFQNLDQLISKHEQKLTKLKNLKKAMLDKMFPKDGTTVPEIRFKGFTGDWQFEDLEEIYNFQYGLFNNNPSNGGKYPVYGANGVIGGYTDFNAQDSVVIGHMGEYAGVVLWVSGKHFVTYNGIITIPKRENFNPNFGYFMLYKINIRKICDGSGQPFLSYETLNRIKGSYPKSNIEQNKIADYFLNLDTLINDYQKQLNKLNNLKQACLTKMFV